MNNLLKVYVKDESGTQSLFSVHRNYPLIFDVGLLKDWTLVLPCFEYKSSEKGIYSVKINNEKDTVEIKKVR
jgi:hypothetical protein